MGKFDHISEMSKFYEMKKSDIPFFGECLARAFDGYPLFSYFMPGKDSADRMDYFWKVEHIPSSVHSELLISIFRRRSLTRNLDACHH